MSPSASTALVCLLSAALWGSAGGGSVILNSNAIKNLAPGPGPPPPGQGPGAGAGADVPLGGAGHAHAGAGSSVEGFGFMDGDAHNLPIDPIQSLSCSGDEQCGHHGYCYASRGTCLPCKRRRKRCARDAMCCPGNQCSNGVCLPVDLDMVQQFTVAETDAGVTVGGGGRHAPDGPEGSPTPDTRPQTAVTWDLALTPRGLEGERCLRSADCSEGLCCARHFWSKICKPVLREGQVCTKHRKKGALGLEIFQRCDCGEGLLCRTQRGGEEHRPHKAGRSLHTCQRH